MESADTLECPECGSENIELASDEVEEYFCEDCRVLFDTETESEPFDPEMYSTSDPDTEKFKEWVAQRTTDSTEHVHWSEQTSPAIVGLIEEPDRIKHEYYRIENPKEFFEGCSGEQDELRRIRESDLEPFETLDLPHVEWKFSV